MTKDERIPYRGGRYTESSFAVDCPYVVLGNGAVLGNGQKIYIPDKKKESTDQSVLDPKEATK